MRGRGDEKEEVRFGEKKDVRSGEKGRGRGW